eukprot:14419160-Heterocapsa_arctica.AAC.1
MPLQPASAPPAAPSASGRALRQDRVTQVTKLPAGAFGALQPSVGASRVGFPPRRLCTTELYSVPFGWPWAPAPAPAGAFGASCSSGSCASGP